MTASPAPSSPRRTDVLIVGAGPVGLFAAFQAGVLGLSCELVEALDAAGGQCVELYPDKPIFDIPALPVCTARELIERLMTQAQPFGAPIHLSQRAETLTRGAEGRFTVTTDGGVVFDAATVLIAGGNGAFAPQRLALDEAAALEGRFVHYAVRQVETFRNRRVIVAGGGDSALDWALALGNIAQHVTLVHRRDNFRAAPATVNAMRAAVADGKISLQIGTIGAIRDACGNALERAAPVVSALDTAASPAGDSSSYSVIVQQREGEIALPADHLLVLYGLVAALGPLAHWGLQMHGGRLDVDTARYETSMPGVFAAGDLAGYPNKQKLILSGFHEASLALRHAFTYARPDKTRTHIHSSYDPRLASTILGDGASAKEA